MAKVGYIIELRTDGDRVAYVGHTCGVYDEIWTMQQVQDPLLAWVFDSHAEASASVKQYQERWDTQSREYVLPSELRARIIVVRR